MKSRCYFCMCNCSYKTKQRKWDAYLEYLKDWADAHTEMECQGMSPVCYDEFIDNDYED